MVTSFFNQSQNASFNITFQSCTALSNSQIRNSKCHFNKLFPLFRAATSEDYRLLETLNKMTISKYQDMSDISKKLTQNMEALNDKCKLCPTHYL